MSYDEKMLAWISVTVLVLGYLFYCWSIATFDFFKRRGVPFVKPYPLVGSLWPVYRGKLHPSEAAIQGYRAFAGQRFSGFFLHRKPVYLIHDPQLVKQMTVKHFGHFTDHMTVVPTDFDPIVGRSLFFAGQQFWRDARAGLSAAFTGSKMRDMFGLLSISAGRAMRRLASDACDETLEKEMRDLFQRLGNDAMTSIAFGVETDSVHDPENEFFLKGKQMIADGNFQSWKVMLLSLIPGRLFKLLGLRLLRKDVADFYVNVVSKSIAEREQSRIVRPDFIHLLLKGRKNELADEEPADGSLDTIGFSTVKEYIPRATRNCSFSDLDITAAAISFFFGGIESTTTLLCFAVYELASNVEIQEKLRAEIDLVREELEYGDLTYEALQGMKYLDMVVSETLRRWPPIGVTDRRCTKPFKISNSDGTEVTIEVGQIVQIPILAFHHDANYFLDPLKFDPERFSEENRDGIDQDTFMPFGSGLRNCIASRLALMQAKCFLFYLLTYFAVNFSSKMELPMKLDKRSPSFNAANGFWIKLVRRMHGVLR